MATIPKTAPKKPTAREKLQASQLRQTQLELMGKDVDLKTFYLQFNDNRFNMLGAVKDVQIKRTIEGASTVTVTVIDQDRALMHSGKLGRKQDIEIDGLFFRMVQVRKSGAILTLTFEDREIAVLRTYAKPIKQSKGTSRTKVTRAQFALRLIREVKEFKIKTVIPELNKVQPIQKSGDTASSASRVANKSFGIPKGTDLTVKGSPMTENQRSVANAILDTAASMLVKRKVMVMAIMAAMQESTLANLRQPLPGAFNYLSSDPAGNPVGVFQQIKKFGWPASRDVATDAHAFLERAAAREADMPSAQYHIVIEAVQHSGNASAYAQWRTEADRIVTQYGLTGGSAAQANNQWTPGSSTGDYEFYRGRPPSTSATNRKQGVGTKDWGKENSWDCLQRLSEEVQWRAFFVSGIFYFISEDDLFKSQPVATLTEQSEGIISIDGDYDEGKKNGQLTITCLMGRWQAPPGSVIQLNEMGPWNGRWLVNDVQRSAFSPIGTITLKKPRPRLPEPAASNLGGGVGTWTGTLPPEETDDPGKQFKVGSGLIQPIPRGMEQPPGKGEIHGTAGLSTGGVEWPAYDFFAKPGTPCLAVENGTIYKLSGHNPLLGAIEGAGGPLGWSIYLKGDSGTNYYYTHLDKRLVGLNQRVKIGQEIATIADYDSFGRQSHTHLAIEPGGHYSIQQLGNALQAVKA